MLIVISALFAIAPASATAASKLRVVTSGNGVVTTSDGRIDCGSRCSTTYRRSRMVRLWARPGSSNGVVHWESGCIGTAVACEIEVGRLTTVAVRFAGYPRRVQGTVSGPGSLFSDPPGIACGAVPDACSADFPEGTVVRLTAVPTAGGFVHTWGEDCTGVVGAVCDIAVTSRFGLHASVMFAHVTPDPGVATLDVVGTTRDLGVVSDPPGIDCLGPCSAVFPSGTVVRLFAPFAQFGGACVGAFRSCSLVVDSHTTVVMTPCCGVTAPPEFGVNVAVSGPGAVSGTRISCGLATTRLLDCEALFTVGSTVVLQARPNRKARFVGWGGFCQGTDPRCPLRVNAAMTVLARFKR